MDVWTEVTTTMSDEYRKLASQNNVLSFQQQERVIERAKQRALDKIEEREHLRLELKAREYIHTVHGCIDLLVEGQEYQKDVLGQPLPTKPKVPLDRTRIQALKAAMDGSLRLLDRVLPPLKAVEVQEDPEKTAANPAKLTTSELIALVTRMSRKPQVIEAETVEPEDKPPWE